MPVKGTINQQNTESNLSITVCVPVYNVKTYLRECLDSIFTQSYDCFDVVMIDDGSTDGSGEICDEYAARYQKRAVVVHKDNEGPLLARRDGIAQATGQYVMCVDSDDALLPGALAIVAATAAKTCADVVRFGFTRDINETYEAPISIPYKFYSLEEKPTMLRALCRSTSGSENPMWFKAIRRSCVGADTDFTPYKGLTFAEDFLQTLTVYDRAQNFCFLDFDLYYYRPGSGITRAYNPHFYLDVCRCLDAAEVFARRWESQYSCEGLMAGLVACRLDSAAQYAEWLATQDNHTELNSLSNSKDFVRCMEDPEAKKILRFDRRLVIWALRRRIYPVVAWIAKVKTVKADR